MAPRPPAANLPRLSPMLPRNPDATAEELLVDVCVERAAQEAFHRFAPVDTVVFAGYADPVWFSALSIRASMQFFRARRAEGTSGDRGSEKPSGQVHVSEALSLLRPIGIGEPLALCQGAAPVREPHRLGQLATTRFECVDAAGNAVLRIERRGIMVQGSSEGSSRTQRASSAADDPCVGKAFVCAKAFTPDIVATFCSPGNNEIGANAIHNDPEYARGAGFAKPIWGGIQGMHIVMEHLFGRCCPAGSTLAILECIATFRRPVFWDERVELWFGQHSGAAVGVGDYVILRPDAGHAAALEMTVENVAYVSATASAL